MPYTGFFLKFFPDSLKLERPWAFTFLGSINPRDRNIDYTFMSFSGSLNKTKKWLMKHSSFSFKLHKNERTKKEWRFYAHVLHAVVHRVIFRLGTHFASMSNGWVIHFLWVMIIPIESLYSTDWLLFRSSMAFGVCFIESMLPIHIIWRANKFEDCMPWVYQLSNPLYHSPCVSPTLITTSSTLFHVD